MGDTRDQYAQAAMDVIAEVITRTWVNAHIDDERSADLVAIEAVDELEGRGLRIVPRVHLAADAQEDHVRYVLYVLEGNQLYAEVRFPFCREENARTRADAIRQKLRDPRRTFSFDLREQDICPPVSGKAIAF